MSGVDSRLNSGRGPRLSVLKRQAISRLLKLVRLTWSSGEYRVLPRSAPYVLHSPFFAPDCPATDTIAEFIKSTSRPSTTTKRHRLSFMYAPLNISPYCSGLRPISKFPSWQHLLVVTSCLADES